MFTCDWCQQAYDGFPILLMTTGLRLSGETEHECVCVECADLADSEEVITRSLVLGFHLLADVVARVAA